MKQFFLKLLFIGLVLSLNWSFVFASSEEKEDDLIYLRQIDPSTIKGVTKSTFPKSNWEEFNFRLWDEKEALTSKNIHVLWGGNYDEFQIIVYDHTFTPVFEEFNPRFVRYACSGGCNYWLKDIPVEIITGGPFFLQVQGVSFTLNTIRYSKVLAFEIDDKKMK